jgi:hypothetical protein
MIGRSPFADGGALVAAVDQPARPRLGVAAGAAEPRRGVAVDPAQLARRMPTREQLTYTRELLTVVLILAAFPWLLSKLLTNPGAVLRGAGVRGVA